jgi:hypothetical protein
MRQVNSLKEWHPAFGTFGVLLTLQSREAIFTNKMFAESKNSKAPAVSSSQNVANWTFEVPIFQNILSSKATNLRLRLANTACDGSFQ